MFNFMKMAEKEVQQTEKALRENNKEHKLEADDQPTAFEKTLEGERKGSDGLTPTERMLDDVRVSESEAKITEGALNDDKSMRSDEGQHPMDYFKKSEEEQLKAWRKAQGNVEAEKDFWDKYVGQQMNGEPTKQVANVQKSQLLSNYDTREEFRKQNRSVKKSSAEENLKTADAMLFHVFRQAALTGRALTDKEEQMVKDINAGKAQILAQITFDPQRNEHDFLSEQQQLEGEHQQEVQDVLGSDDYNQNDLGPREEGVEGDVLMDDPSVETTELVDDGGVIEERDPSQKAGFGDFATGPEDKTEGFDPLAETKEMMGGPAAPAAAPAPAAPAAGGAMKPISGGDVAPMDSMMDSKPVAAPQEEEGSYFDAMNPQAKPLIAKPKREPEDQLEPRFFDEM